MFVGVALIVALISCVAHTSEKRNENGNANESKNVIETSSAGANTARLIGTIHLPGNGGFTDYLIVSPETHRLYAGYRTENKLFVVDTEHNTVVA